jgi:hypothetical protein
MDLYQDIWHCIYSAPILQPDTNCWISHAVEIRTASRTKKCTKHITADAGNALCCYTCSPSIFVKKLIVTLRSSAWGNTTSLKLEILSPLHKHAHAHTHTHTAPKLMTLVSLLPFCCNTTFHIGSAQECCLKMYLTWHFSEITWLSDCLHRDRIQ